VLLNGASYWSAFEKPQLDALALGFLSLRGQGIGAMSAYWGLWLVPLGVEPDLAEGRCWRRHRVKSETVVRSPDISA
jgi:hypothetical protein